VWDRPSTGGLREACKNWRRPTAPSQARHNHSVPRHKPGQESAESARPIPESVVLMDYAVGRTLHF